MIAQLFSVVAAQFIIFVSAAPDRECGVAMDIGSRSIVGGTQVGGLKYPWIALLSPKQSSSNKPQCIGSLISPYHILTAAHCFRTPWMKGMPFEDYYEIGLGIYDWCSEYEENHIWVETKQVEVHERYIFLRHSYDIAILHLEYPVNYTTLCLPDLANTHHYVKQYGRIVGWGRTSFENKNLPCTQRHAVVRRYTTKQCERTDLPRWIVQNHRMFCAAERHVDSCSGDSGGPFLTQTLFGNYVLTGIVSFGINCAKKDKPGVYTDVQSYLGWICSKIDCNYERIYNSA